MFGAVAAAAAAANETLGVASMGAVMLRGPCIGYGVGATGIGLRYAALG